jgi:predicted DNA-binding antitoxin AbrB/MazE fold protein
VMSQHIHAIFEKGVFRPEVPVYLPEGQRVSLDVTSESVAEDDLCDVADLLDSDYITSCRQKLGAAPTLEEARTILSAYSGSLADAISDERDEQ